MGPKAKKANKPSKKNVEKKKEKLADDKTFGLKNKKKSKAVQQYVQQVHQQVKGTSLRVSEFAFYFSISAQHSRVARKR